MIDRVRQSLDVGARRSAGGFKWFVEGLLDGSFGFGGEESAGASFYDATARFGAQTKTVLILGLLAAEITAKVDRDPGEYLSRPQASEFGAPIYQRIDAPATAGQKAILQKLSHSNCQRRNSLEKNSFSVDRCAWEWAAIGGLRASPKWLVCRPPIGNRRCLQDLCREFSRETHLGSIREEAQALITKTFMSEGG
jgi:phosphoglucomutase